MCATCGGVRIGWRAVGKGRQYSWDQAVLAGSIALLKTNQTHYTGPQFEL